MPSILKHIAPDKPVNKIHDFNYRMSSKCFTRNYIVLSYRLSRNQLNLLNFLLIKVNTANYICLNTELINRYRNLSIYVSKDAASTNSVKPQKAYSNVVRDIISLINLHVFIQLSPNSNHYLLNPAYSYCKNPIGIPKMAGAFNSNYLSMQEKGTLTLDEVKKLAIGYYLSAIKLTINIKQRKIPNKLYKTQYKPSRTVLKERKLIEELMQKII